MEESLPNDDNEFKKVIYKKSKRRPKNPATEQLNGLEGSAAAVEVDLDKFFARLKSTRSELRLSGFFRNLNDLVLKGPERFQEILCLGVGSIASCQIAFHQLVLLLELQSALKISAVSIYDPIFTAQEKQILEKLNCKVIEENMQGKHKVHQQTLAYFPHCPHELTENFLGANWTAEDLKRIALICNSFDRYTTTEPPRLVQERTPLIASITDYTQITEIKNSYKYDDVFNDTALHRFQMESLSENSEFWDK